MNVKKIQKKNIEDDSNNPRVVQQNKKPYFRITSVVDTTKNEGDNVSETLNDGNTGTEALSRDNSENKRENPSSKIPKRNRAKNSQDLKSSPDTPDDRSNRGGKVNTEDDTEDEEFNPPNKPKPSSKDLDSITTLKIEVKESKGKDTDANKSNERPNAANEEHRDMNIVSINDNEHEENSEQNKLCPESAKIKILKILQVWKIHGI